MEVPLRMFIIPAFFHSFKPFKIVSGPLGEAGVSAAVHVDLGHRNDTEEKSKEACSKEGKPATVVSLRRSAARELALVR